MKLRDAFRAVALQIAAVKVFACSFFHRKGRFAQRRICILLLTYAEEGSQLAGGYFLTFAIH